MRPIFIHSCHKQSYSVWSFRSLLSFNLRFCITISLLSAILKINLFNGWFDPQVSLQLSDQFLMYLQRTRASAVSPEMAIPMKSSTLNILSWQQASSEGSFLRLQSTTYQLDLRPRQMEPCLTASMAYSTWKSFPCGDQVTQSRSQSPLSIV